MFGYKVLNFTFISVFLLLSACGGGSSTSIDTSINNKPVAVITSEDELVEGSTLADLDASSSTDNDGSVSSYLWAIENNGGIANLTLTDTTSVSTQITGIPSSLSADVKIIISLIVTDNDNENSVKTTKTITFKNDTSLVNTGNFDGIWHSPCFNNSFGSSVKQTLNINGDIMTSNIKSFTIGTATTPAINCIVPDSGIIINSGADVVLVYGEELSNSNCLNETGVDTELNVSKVISNGKTYSETAEISNFLASLTGYLDVIPNSSTLCNTDEGNLVFGGYTYTREANTSIIDMTSISPFSHVTWEINDVIVSSDQSVDDLIKREFIAKESKEIITDNVGELTIESENFVTISSIDSNFNNHIETSVITINYSLSGPGIYSITDSVTQSSYKELSISVSLSSSYPCMEVPAVFSQTSNISPLTVEVSVDENEKYHFTTHENIELIYSGFGCYIGLPPAGYYENILKEVKIENIHNFSN